MSARPSRPPFTLLCQRPVTVATITAVTIPPAQPHRTWAGKCTPAYTLVKPIRRIRTAERRQNHAFFSLIDAAVQKAMELKACPEGMPEPVAVLRKCRLGFTPWSTSKGLGAFITAFARSVQMPPDSTVSPTT